MFIYSFYHLSFSVNRRLDEWVKLEQLDLDSVEAVVDEKVEDKVLTIAVLHSYLLHSSVKVIISIHTTVQTWLLAVHLV